MDNQNFVSQHYARHAQHFENDLVDPERIRISASWFDETTADYWRHARAYECGDLLRGEPTASWLTVGDGRWGLDAIRLRKKGFSSVLATDISEALLRAAKERGLIEAYAVENAEKLSFADKSFDYIFCKESLHHFPRPYVALYEMLRVARKGVFLIEPNDTWDVTAPTAPVQGDNLLKRISRRLMQAPATHQPVNERPKLHYNQADWETSGNYVYALSRREVEKIALGLNLPQIVVKGLNDHYVKGCEFEPADVERSSVFRELVSMIDGKDALCRSGQADYNLIMAGILLHPLPTDVRAAFAAADWDVVDLPANPYIPRAS